MSERGTRPSRLSRVHRWIRRVWVAGGLAFMAALAWNVQAHGVDAALLESDAGVSVSEAGPATAFIPASVRPDAPLLVLLPGGMIDWRAYVPLARGLAVSGVPTTIVQVPWRSAPTDGTRLELWARVAAAAEQWGAGRPIVLAGHSRGAALAARLVAEQAPTSSAMTSRLGGLILIGTTHPRDHDLSAVRFPVLRITASQDCVAPPADALANARNLPGGTEWVEILGGNHRQFGYYGWQIGDCTASITREEQHRQAIAAVTSFLAPRP